MGFIARSADHIVGAVEGAAPYNGRDKLKFVHHLILKEGTLWTLAVVPAFLSEVASTGCP